MSRWRYMPDYDESAPGSPVATPLLDFPRRRWKEATPLRVMSRKWHILAEAS